MKASDNTWRVRNKIRSSFKLLRARQKLNIFWFFSVYRIVYFVFLAQSNLNIFIVWCVGFVAWEYNAFMLQLDIIIVRTTTFLHLTNCD